MNKNSGIISVFALIVSILAFAMCFWKCNAKNQTEAQTANSSELVAAALLEKPEMVIDALNAYEIQQRAKAEEAAREQIKPYLEQVYDDQVIPAIFNPEGKMVLVEFFDFSCGYCHRLYPEMQKVAQANPDVKIIAKPVAFLGPNSLYAAQAVLAAGEQGKYVEMYNALFAINEQLTQENVDKAAESIGLNMDKYKADVASDVVSQKLNDSQSLAQKIGVDGVPTLVFNGTKFNAGSADFIQTKIDEAKSAQ